MWGRYIVHKGYYYFQLKGQTYYFSHRMPKRLWNTSRLTVSRSACIEHRCHQPLGRRWRCLKKAKEHWYFLKRQDIKQHLEKVFGDHQFTLSGHEQGMLVGSGLQQLSRPDCRLRVLGRPRPLRPGRHDPWHT